MKGMSKAIAAGSSGGVLGIAGAVALLPEGTPWYAHLAIIVLGIVLPFVATYFAPGNQE